MAPCSILLQGALGAPAPSLPCAWPRLKCCWTRFLPAISSSGWGTGIPALTPWLGQLCCVCLMSHPQSSPKAQAEKSTLLATLMSHLQPLAYCPLVPLHLPGEPHALMGSLLEEAQLPFVPHG